MSILVVSADDDAARSLCSALTRAGEVGRWERRLEGGRSYADNEAPAVLVLDTSIEQYESLIDHVRDATPWARVYLMADPAVAFPQALAPVVQKPFDAAEFAALLAREKELAELERNRRTLQVRADALAQLVEASFEAIIGLGPDARVVSWNPGAAATYGYTAAEIIGRSIDVLELDANAARDRLMSPTREVVEVTRRRKDGSHVQVLLSLSPVGQPGSSFGYAEVSLDITARRKLERELEHAERLAAIGRIAASMAHEINNPLSVIRASVSYVAGIAVEHPDPELAESVTDMEYATERIGSFVQHVCGFARRERPHLTDASILGTLDIALRMVRPRANDRGVDMKIAAGAHVVVPHDPPRIAQAVMNVLSNAVDAAADGGRHVELRVVSDPQWVRIQVDDDGPGISDDIRAQLFEPFATTKPPGQGTGLGLAITRQILEDHGGDVTLTPRSVGTRAELTIPNFDVSAHHIVVIDDDPAVRRALAAELRRERFTVSTARLLADALEILAQGPVRVAVTDVRLADAEGAEVIVSLRAASPQTRCLVVSAAEGAGGVGADLVVPKPWGREKLIAAVRQLCIAEVAG